MNPPKASVKNGGRPAFALLKSLGTLDRPTPGSTDPEEVEQRMEIERRENESDLSESDLLASLGGYGLGRGKRK